MTSAADRLRFQPAAPLLLGFAGAAAVAGTLVAIAVAQGWGAGLDRAILLALRGSAAGAPLWFQEAMRDVTALGSMIVLMLVVTVVVAFLCAASRYRLAGLLVASSLATTAYSTALKMLFHRARPEIVEPAMATFTASFPSGHAMLSAAILLTNGGLLAMAARTVRERWVIGSAAILLTTLVGLSRVSLGVHWPSDVLAGWLFGTVWACLTLYCAERIAPAPRS